MNSGFGLSLVAQDHTAATRSCQSQIPGEPGEAAESEVLSLVDHTHTATTEFLEDAVVGDDLPGK